MAAETSKVPCPAGEWTEVATGVANILLQMANAANAAPVGFRVAIGSAAPSDAATGIVVATSSQGLNLNGLAATNVYAYPLSVAGEAQVLTW